jgi:hypothetical protein
LTSKNLEVCEGLNLTNRNPNFKNQFNFNFRSPLSPGRPSYSAELMSMTYNGGSLPSTSGSQSRSRSRMNLGSAPDLTSSPVTNIWTNPMSESTGEATKQFSSIVSSRKQKSKNALSSFLDFKIFLTLLLKTNCKGC